MAGKVGAPGSNVSANAGGGGGGQGGPGGQIYPDANAWATATINGTDANLGVNGSGGGGGGGGGASNSPADKTSGRAGTGGKGGDGGQVSLLIQGAFDSVNIIAGKGGSGGSGYPDLYTFMGGGGGGGGGGGVTAIANGDITTSNLTITGYDTANWNGSDNRATGGSGGDGATGTENTTNPAKASSGGGGGATLWAPQNTLRVTGNLRMNGGKGAGLNVGTLYAQNIDIGTSNVHFQVGTLVIGNDYSTTINGSSSDTTNDSNNGIGIVLLQGNQNLKMTSGSGAVRLGQLAIANGTLNDTNWNNLAGASFTNPAIDIRAQSDLTVAINGQDRILSRPLTGEGNLIKDGSKTLTLNTGDSTFTGSTTIRQGTLALQNQARLPNSFITVEGIGTLDISGSATTSIGIAGLRGSGTVNLGRNNLTLNAASDFSGNITGQNGSLTINASLYWTGQGSYRGATSISEEQTLIIVSAMNASGTTISGTLDPGSQITIGKNGSLEFMQNAATDQYTFTNHITGAGDLYQYGPGKLILGQSNDYTGDTYVYSGVLSIASDLSVGGKPNAIGRHILSNGTLELTGNTYDYDWTLWGLNNTIRVASGITADFGGKLTDQNVDGTDYTSGFTLAGGGTLQLTGASNDWTGATVLADNSTLYFNPPATSPTATPTGSPRQLLTGKISGSGKIIQDGEGFDNATEIGGLNLNGDVEIIHGELRIQGYGNHANNILVHDNCKMVNGHCAVPDFGDFVMLGIHLTSSGALTPGGSGQSPTPLTVNKLSFETVETDPDAYQSNGINFVSFDSKTPVSMNVIEANEKITGFDMEAMTNEGYRVVRALVGGDPFPADYLSLLAELVPNSRGVADAAIRVTAGLTWYAPLGNQGGDFTIQNSFEVKVPLENRPAIIDRDGDGHTDDSWDGKSLNKKGPGTLILSALNTFDGQVTVSDGTLQLGNGTQTGGIAQASQIVLQADSNALTVPELHFNQGSDTVFDREIIGDGNVVIEGTKAVTLSRDNPQFTGNLTVEGGTLVYDRDAVLGSGDHILDGASLNPTGENYQSAWQLSDKNNVIKVEGDVKTFGPLTDALPQGQLQASSGGTLIKDGSGNLNLTSQNTYTGPTRILNGTLTVSGSLMHGDYSAPISNDSQLVFDQDRNQTLSGTISGTGDLTKDGVGTLTLTTANTYSGETIVRAGTLALSRAGSTGPTISLLPGTVIDVSNLNASTWDYSNRALNFAVDRDSNNLPTNGVHAHLIAGSKTINLSNATLTFDMAHLAETTKLVVQGGTVNVTNAKINLIASSEIATLASGDSVILLTADNPLIGRETLDQQKIDVRHGLFDYLFTLSAADPYPNELSAYFGSRRPHENAGSITYGSAARVSALLIASDHMLEQIENWKYSGLGTFAPEPGIDARGFSSFGDIQFSSMRTKTGSYIESNGVSAIVGAAWDIEAGAGDWLTGIYFDAGRGSYDSYMSQGIDGDGDGETWFYGAGLFSKYTFADGYHIEGSLHGGNANVEYNGKASMAYMHYSTRAPFVGAHLGFGFAYHFSNVGMLDFALKGIWLRQFSDTFNTAGNTSEKIKFSDVTSQRSQLSVRYVHNPGDKLRWSIGVGWEYEFDGESKAWEISPGNIHTLIPHKNKLRGHSGWLDVGFSWRASDNWIVDLDLSGWAGQRKGGHGNLSMKYKF